MSNISPGRIKELVNAVRFHRDRALEAIEGGAPQEVDVQLWEVMENKPQDLEAAIRRHKEQVHAILEAEVGEWYDEDLWALLPEDDS